MKRITKNLAKIFKRSSFEKKKNVLLSSSLILYSFNVSSPLGHPSEREQSSTFSHWAAQYQPHCSYTFPSINLSTVNVVIAVKVLVSEGK